MTVKIRFQIYRKRDLKTGRYSSIALYSLSGRIFSMKELQSVVENYTISCEPKFKDDDERPMIDHFILEFEDYMYNAFLIAET